MGFNRFLVDSSTAIIGRVRRNRRIKVKADLRDGFVKVNIGSGLEVKNGWINVDASLNALIASWPPIFHKILYQLSGSSKYYSKKQYCDLLSKHIFVHHDLTYGIPMEDESVDYIFSSHFLEHLF